MGLCARSLLVVAALMGALASTASAQAPPTIDAVDSPVQAFQPDAVTVTTGDDGHAGSSTRRPRRTRSPPPAATGTSTRRATSAARPSTHTFNAPGTYTFNCKFHPSMTGTVTVNAPASRASTRSSSRAPPASATPTRSPPARPRSRRWARTATSPSTLSEDPTKFTDAGLRPYEVVVFLNDDGEGILNAAQRTAFERWTQRGGGIVAHPRRRQRRPQLGLEGRHDGRRVVRQPPGRRAPVPDRHGQSHRRHAPRHRRRPGELECARTSGTTSPPSRRTCTSCSSSTRAPTSSRTAATASTTITRSRGARTTTAGATSTPRSATRARTGQSRSTSPTSAARSSGPPARKPGDCGPERDGPPDRRVVRQGHARRHDREPDGDRGRPPTATSSTSSSPARSSTTTPANGSVRADRHDPGPPRQRERPARDHARPELRDQPLAVPLLQRAVARGAARLALHARRRRHGRHGVGEGAAAGPPPADHLLPLVRLADVRARRQPLHLHRRRHRARGVAGLRAARRPAARTTPGDNPDADHAYDSRRTSGNTNDLRGKILRITPEDGRDVHDPGRATCSRRSRATRPRRGPRSTRWATATRSGSRSTRRPAGSTTARSGRTRTARTPTAARAATTSSTRSARRATWAGRTASPTTSRTATGRSRTARPARRSTARTGRPTRPTTTPA